MKTALLALVAVAATAVVFAEDDQAKMHAIMKLTMNILVHVTLAGAGPGHSPSLRFPVLIPTVADLPVV
jgi:hypothetical protein